MVRHGGATGRRATLLPSDRAEYLERTYYPYPNGVSVTGYRSPAPTTTWVACRETEPVAFLAGRFAGEPATSTR